MPATGNGDGGGSDAGGGPSGEPGSGGSDGSGGSGGSGGQGGFGGGLAPLNNLEVLEAVHVQPRLPGVSLIQLGGAEAGHGFSGSVEVGNASSEALSITLDLQGASDVACEGGCEIHLAPGETRTVTVSGLATTNDVRVEVRSVLAGASQSVGDDPVGVLEGEDEQDVGPEQDVPDIDDGLVPEYGELVTPELDEG